MLGSPACAGSVAADGSAELPLDRAFRAGRERDRSDPVSGSDAYGPARERPRIAEGSAAASRAGPGARAARKRRPRST